MRKNIFLIVCLLVAVSFAVCACRRPVQERKVVVEADGASAVVSAWELRGDKWRKVFSTPDGWVGQAGVVDAKEKREGDAGTPAGIFEMRRAFGMKENPDTQLEYRQVQPGDMWVDDPESAYYNQYVTADSLAKRDWKSAEELRPLAKSYQYAIVVEYNTDPVVPGRGSAIFLNCSPDRPVKATMGDIGVPEKYMRKFFKFVRPGDKIEIKRVAEK